MSANSGVKQKLNRIKQSPIDVWSIREKLALASSVQKSGDQNWSSVSRTLHPFAEPNRPNDWYNQKYCALQYQELLDQIETEMPKRNRREKGELTAEDLIVQKLTNERIEELRKLTEKQRLRIKEVKRDLESIRNNEMDEKRVQEVLDQKLAKEKAQKEAKIAYKKFLEEREVKIAQMRAMRGTVQTNRPKPPMAVTTVSQTPTTTVTTTPSPTKSAINEPLKVNIDSEPATTQTSTTVTINENKLTLALSTPSTSPLLTSLLQSPTPSTPTILSPNKSGLSANTFTRQTSFSQTPTQSAVTSSPVSRRPSIHSSPEKVVSLNSPEKNESNATIQRAVSPVITGNNNNTQSSPTLSKLLELPASPTAKPPPMAVIETQTTPQKQSQEQKIQNEELDKTQESEELDESQDTAESETICSASPIKSPTKVNPKQDSANIDETREIEEIKVSPINSVPTEDTNTEEADKILEINRTEEPVEAVKPSAKKTEESVEKINIKLEIIDTPEEEPEKDIVDKTSIKEEPMDTTTAAPIATPDNPKPSTSELNSNRSKRKKPLPTPSLSTTPTITRRSGRVKALRDSKVITDDSTEVSDQSSANTPQAPKKRGSVDETTETSMSEESMDAKSALTAPLNESVPNSPASSIVQTEDPENAKYKIWKKAILVPLRSIGTHKYAGLFDHPVTENEAKGYNDIVHRPMDLATIKKRIENGTIRTTVEFQRDVMLMFQNAIMFNNANHHVHREALEMQKETLLNIEDFIETQTQQHNNQKHESKTRGRERRSTAIVSPLINENEVSVRRKSRGASTDTDSSSTLQPKTSSRPKKKAENRN